MTPIWVWLHMEQIDPVPFVFGVELRGLGTRCVLFPWLSSISRLPLRWNAEFAIGQNLTFSLISYV